MDKLKVFISSTMTELHDERVVVKQALDERNMEAVWFEDFGAQPATPQQAYLAAVAECDVYLGLFWNRYSAATAEEYRRAGELSKPNFIYVKNFNLQRDDELTKLLGEIGQTWVYKTFNNVVELGDHVRQDIIGWLVTEYRKTRATVAAAPLAQAVLPTTEAQPGAPAQSAFARLGQLIRTLPRKRVSFADQQAVELIQSVNASAVVKVADADLGRNHSVVVLDVASEGRTERVAVQFVNGEIKAGKRELIKKLDALKVDVAYVVPSIPSPQAQKPSAAEAQIVSLEDLHAQLKKLGL